MERQERDDYSGPFDPDFRYEDLSKDALVRLVREYALTVHLLDRSGLAAVGMRYGQDAVEEIAIDEWRGASPVYGERLRRILGIEGDDVAAIFKVLQVDPGFPHHYMDVRYEVVDERHGYFELAYCGALMDVEPWGDRAVTGMCHTIEDGTFDVTAQAVNPKARIRHVHRPPRSSPDQEPHCRWEVVIDDDTETLPEAAITAMTRRTTPATFVFPPLRDGTPHDPGATTAGHPPFRVLDLAGNAGVPVHRTEAVQGRGLRRGRDRVREAPASQPRVAGARVAGATKQGSYPMSEGQDQSIFEKAKDMAGGLKDKVTDAIHPEDEQSEGQDSLQDQAQEAEDEMRSAREDVDPTDQGGMAL